MPTARPRITITLTAHTYEVLSRLSAASGDSMSQIVTGFVDLAAPSLERVLVVLERARSAPEEVRDGLRASFERAERDLMPGLLESLSQSEMFMAQVEADTQPKQAEGGPAQRGVPPPAGAIKRVATPVLVTRGSGGGKTLRASSGSRSKGSSRG